MPELVEVKMISRFLYDTIAEKKLTCIEILSTKYFNTPSKFVGFENFIINLPYIITDVNTKGKFMWITLMSNDIEYYLLFSHGLDGSWQLNKDKNSIMCLNFTDLQLYFNIKLGFGSSISFGNIDILNEKLNSLGEDLFFDTMTTKKLTERLESIRNKKAKIIKVLLDQNKKTGIGSGIGNYLSAEILYEAKISPHCTIKQLLDNDLLAPKLSNAINIIIQSCYMNSNAFYEKNGIYTLFNYRVYKQKEDLQGNQVIKEKIVSSRQTYWVPSVQK